MLDQAQQDTGHAPTLRNAAPVIEVRNLNLWYEDKQALKEVAFDLYTSEILAFIGPSGCGKSTALKCLNRMHDGTRGVRIDPPLHRRRFGWVAQKPNPFPASIWDNVAYGARIHGLAKDTGDLADQVESCLRRAHLWDEVKDHLYDMEGTELSGGQQQRLCIARALSTQPEVLLMDEPTGSIDPIATAKVEELLLTLREDHSVVIITHSMMEARRIADRVAFFHLGELVEVGPTDQIFNHPVDPRLQNFIAGKMG